MLSSNNFIRAAKVIINWKHFYHQHLILTNPKIRPSLPPSELMFPLVPTLKLVPTGLLKRLPCPTLRLTSSSTTKELRITSLLFARGNDFIYFSEYREKWWQKKRSVRRGGGTLTAKLKGGEHNNITAY